MLERYCRENGYTDYTFYVDDGYSGTTFERPAFKQMIADVEAGTIRRVIIKDLSRFGRDYLQVGMYTEVLFAQHDIHFIAIANNVDSQRETMILLRLSTCSTNGTRGTAPASSGPWPG